MADALRPHAQAWSRHYGDWHSLHAKQLRVALPGVRVHVQHGVVARLLRIVQRPHRRVGRRVLRNGWVN